MPDRPPVCWSCNRRDDAAASVTVRAPAGGEATFVLCRQCYDAISPAAIALAEDAGFAITRREGRSARA